MTCITNVFSRVQVPDSSFNSKWRGERNFSIFSNRHIQCSWDAEATENSVLLFSGLMRIQPVKCYGDGDSVFLTFLLSHGHQFLSRAAILSGISRSPSGTGTRGCSEVTVSPRTGLLWGCDYWLGANPAWQASSLFLGYAVVFCSWWTYLFFPFWCSNCPCVVW